MASYVPLSDSLSSDAPGWSNSTAEPQRLTSGPTCWKCRGTKVNRKGDKECPVCKGVGTLPPKPLKVKDIPKEDLSLAEKLGYHIDISSARPWASPDSERVQSLRLPHYSKVHPKRPRHPQSTLTSFLPPLLSSQPPARYTLSPFTGHWRILQEPKGGHRFTTDDLLTAHVASSSKRHLDLGCGNGSVLLAVQHQSGPECCSVGIESRDQAARLARASIMYNMGEDATCSVVRGDFRDPETVRAAAGNLPSCGGDCDGPCAELVTGTPPYFAVDFTREGGIVKEGTIRQGGMPTNMESAPARCEFRGGVDDYVVAAEKVLCKVEGARIVVCINTANFRRVYEGCERAGGVGVDEVWEVEGGEGKGTLFGIFVIRRGVDSKSKGRVVVITVRDKRGNWTPEYEEIMNQMCFNSSIC